MAKAKAKADKIRKKRKEPQEKVNPFEIKVNRQKHKILNRKLAKSDKGVPGVSRSRGIQKRKETLLTELKRRGKAGGLVDGRFGENDPTISVEEKMLKRFAIERKKRGKSSKYLLEDDEDLQLTHLGQSLADIEKFQEPVHSDDEDDEDRGKISADIVASQHFGGGLLTKDPKNKKTWQQRLEDVISESKQRKHERQKDKEEVEAAREKLDEDWKELRLLMKDKKRKKGEEDNDGKAKADSYDMAVRELQFDLKAQATDRLKSEEELAKEEKDRLENLEAERIRRMKGIKPKDPTYKSADDLDVGSYLKSKKSTKGRGKKRKRHSEDEEEEEEHGEKKAADGLGGEGDEQDDEEGENSEDDEESDDSGDDDVDVDSSDEEEVGQEEESDSASESPADQEKQDTREDAEDELPYVFKAPATYEDLESLLAHRDTESQLVIMSRLRSCHHPSLAEGNKQKLGQIFRFLLQYHNIILARQPPNLQLASGLAPHFYALTQMNRLAAAQAVRDQLEEFKKEYVERATRRGGKGVFPNLHVLMFFKLLRLLFPTSDWKHSVVTPAMLFMGHILAKSTIATTRDIAAGLLLSTIFLEYVSESKRFVPEIVHFLKRVLEPSKVKLLATCSSEDSDVDTSSADRLNIKKIFTPKEAIVYLESDMFKKSALHCTQTLLKTALEPQEGPKTLIKARKDIPSIKMMDPQIFEDFDPIRKKGGSDKQRLTKKLQKETKGAIREIKKDMQFVHKVKLQDQLQKDSDRKSKVAKIMSDLAAQEGYVRTLKRLKDRL